MHPRSRASLLWGAVGAFAFLVLAQGRRLVASGAGPGLPALLLVAVGVGALTALAAYVADGWLAKRRV